jgi:hypothetical protein
MVESVTVVPEQLRQAAAEHRETAEHLRTVPSTNVAVLATLDSLGPVFAQLRDAGRQLLDQRRVCYEQQAAAHTDLADQLSRIADVWEHHDATAAEHLRVAAEGTQ